MPDDWKLDGKAEQPAGTVVFTASKYGTPVVTWTFKNDSATDPDKPADPGTDALKNVAATADGKPIAGFDPTRDGAYKVAAGAKVRISDVPSDWKLDKTESGSKLVFTASKGGTAVTWTFEYQANGGSSATDPGNGGGSNAGGDGQGDPGKTPDTSKPAASPKPAGTADDGQAAGARPARLDRRGHRPCHRRGRTTRHGRGLPARGRGCISSSRCFVFSHVFFSGLGSCMHFPYFSGCAEVFLPNMRASLTRRLWPVNSRSRPWCTMRSMIAAASLSSAKTVPHLLNSMFVVNMMLRLS